MLKRIIVVALVIIVALGMARSVLADGAPPEPPPGTTIETGNEATKVQMVSENVLMTIGDDLAYVKANFQLKNQGTAAESMEVRFPLGWPYSDLPSTFPNRIENLAAYVDGIAVDVITKGEPFTFTNCVGCATIYVPWAVWHMTFPPGQTVSLDVIYQTYPAYGNNSGLPEAFASYRYILATGAGWYRTIGDATITVRLPYDVNAYNTLIEERGFVEPAGYTVTGTDLVWHLTSFEPGESDNLRIKLMSPSRWRDLKQAEQVVISKPDSIDAHHQLALALRNALDFDPSHGIVEHYGKNSDLLDRAFKEYEWIMQRAGDIGPYHSEYMELFGRSIWAFDETCQALDRGTILFPDDVDLKQFTKDTSKLCVDGHRVRPSLSRTAIVKATATAMPNTPSQTPSPEPVQTQAPSTANEEPKPEDSSPFPLAPIIGAVGLIGLAAFFAVRWYRRRSG